jgi:glycogen synthase
MGAPLSRQQQAEIHGMRNARAVDGNFKLEWMDEPWDDLRRAADWLLSLEQRVQPDLVHLNGYVHGALL